MAEDKAPQAIIEQIDTLDLVKSQVEQALGLEEKAGEKIVRIFTKSRRELLDRLASATISDFQSYQIAGVLAQIQAVLSALKADMRGAVAEDAMAMATNGVSDSLDQVEAMDDIFLGATIPIDINQTLVAADTSNLLLDRFDNSFDEYGSSLVTRMHNALIQAVAQRKPYADIVREIAGINGFMAGEAWRAQRIVRTELHNVYDTAKLNSLFAARDEGGMSDLMKMSYDPIDHRTGEDSRLVAGQVRQLDKPFTYKLNGKLYSFMNHPNRPNDRGMTMPYRKGWARQAQPSMLPERIGSKKS